MPESHDKHAKRKATPRARHTSTPRVGGVGSAVEPEALEAARTQRARIQGRRKIAGVAVALACVAVLAIGIALALGQAPDSASVSQSASTKAEAAAATGPTTVSLSAVGDNLIHTPVMQTADAAEGTMDDGLYDFTVLYQGIAPIIESHDINFINIETPMAGDEKGFSGGEVRSVSNAPVFNTPSDNAADIAAFGFNLATTATNHTYDMGLEGVLAMNEIWAEHPEVVVAGTYSSAEDRENIRVFEKNGITFAFLAYTTAVNDGVPDGAPDWAVAFVEDDVITSEVQRAHELADCVIVAVSWGGEDYTDIAIDQRKYGQFLANLDVDLVLGFHSHTLGPIEWVENRAAEVAPGEAPHRTLVTYSLGDITGNMPKAQNNVTGVFTCDFVRDETGGVSVANPGWTPCVIHFSGGGGYTVYQLKDYTPELAATSDIFGGMEDPIGWIKDFTLQVIDPQVVQVSL